MSVEKLLAALEKEALLREEAVLEKARAGAVAELDAARKKAEEIGKMAQAMREEFARQQESAQRARARMEARAMTLRRGWATVDMAFRITGELYAEFMNGPEYAPFISKKLSEAMERIGRAEVALADPVTAKALEGAPLPIQPDGKAEMGFTIHAAGGGSRVHFQFPLALAALWKREAPSHHRALFGEGSDAG